MNKERTGKVLGGGLRDSSCEICHTWPRGGSGHVVARMKMTKWKLFFCWVPEISESQHYTIKKKFDRWQLTDDSFQYLPLGSGSLNHLTYLEMIWYGQAFINCNLKSVLDMLTVPQACCDEQEMLTFRSNFPNLPSSFCLSSCVVANLAKQQCVKQPFSFTVLAITAISVYFLMKIMAKRCYFFLLSVFARPWR